MSYQDYAKKNFRPSENVENRARRGMNGTAQRWAIKTQNAERELRQMQQGDFDDRVPYGTKDIEDWINASGYRGYRGGKDPYDFDEMILKGKLANATGKGHIVEGKQQVQSIPGITDAMYPDEIRLHDEPMRPIEGGLKEYNGGLAPFAGGGLARRIAAAAVRYGDEIFRGPTHGHAFDELIQKHGEDLRPEINRPEAQGFVTSDGEFLTREEAADLARSNGQLYTRKGVDPNRSRMGAEDLIGGDYDDPAGYAGGGLVHRLTGKLSTIRRDVPGKPSTVKIPGYGEVHADPIKEVTESADNYMRKVGRPGAHHIEAYQDFDEERAARIAEAFDRMQHNPADPEVRRAYDAMISETLDQYQSLKDSGVDFHFMRDGEADPYAKSPALGYADVIENGRLTVFPTDQGYGTLSEINDNPLLKRVGKVGDLENATANDAFRAVHDMYGHFGPGNPFFRHKGEERAWENHSKMYSDDALPAMTSETRGQNSWMNFGPYAEHNRTASGADSIFADQKVGLLPEWAYKGYATGGLVGGMAATAEMAEEMDPVEDAMFLGSLARSGRQRLKGLHDKQWTNPPPQPQRDKTERQLWKQEGIGVNRDNLPMFEIPDNEAKLIGLPPSRDDIPDWDQFQEAKRAWDEGLPDGKTYLGYILDHPKLFDEMPELEEIPMRFRVPDKSWPETQRGALNTDGKDIVGMEINRKMGEGDILSTILHELQHGVQTKEGWTQGSNLDFANSLVKRQQTIEQRLLNAQNLRDSLDAGVPLDDLIADHNKFISHLSPEDREWALTQAQRLSGAEIEELYRDARRAGAAFRDPFTAYQLNDGEVMARNVQNRQGLTDGQRRKTFWKDTEDRRGEPRTVGRSGMPVWD